MPKPVARTPHTAARTIPTIVLTACLALAGLALLAWLGGLGGRMTERTATPGAVAGRPAGSTPQGGAPVASPQTGQAALPQTAAEATYDLMPEVMAWWIEPAAAVLLTAASRDTPALRRPDTPEAWQAVADAATELGRTAGALGRGAMAQGRVEWVAYSSALERGTRAGAAAAARRDREALAEAGTAVQAACDGCHTRYGSHGRPAR